MNIAGLRAKHPRFIYQSFEINEITDAYAIRYHFFLEPDIHFAPEIVIPKVSKVSDSANSGNQKGFPELLSSGIQGLVFDLGMVESISYWKAACPPELVVEAGSLSGEQTTWWHDLFINGLEEFFYKNQIDFTQPNFLTITATGANPADTTPGVNLDHPRGEHSGDLILVGGGKDSAVTLELVSKLPEVNNVLLLNPTPAALAVSQTAGYDSPIIVKRTIDPKLIELNKNGYLNGHTPFSAYLAFLGTLVATAHGYNRVITSNEASASEGSLEYLGHSINHQYSKSYEFETKFREYCIRPGLLASKGRALNLPDYFSFLRPINELQTATLFASMPNYHRMFISCNANRGAGWCGLCAKCAFVYTVLSPFLSQKTMTDIFGSDFFEKPGLYQHFLDLAGVGDHKPFDCVGTPDETRDAVALTIANYQRQNIILPPLLLELKDKLNIPDIIESNRLFEKLKTSWNPSHFLPTEYEKILRLALKTIHD